MYLSARSTSDVNLDICPQRWAWCFPKGSKKLARWYECMAFGLEMCVSLTNRTKHPEVGVFEKSDTDVRQAVDAGSGKNPPMPAIISTTLSKENEGYR